MRVTGKYAPLYDWFIARGRGRTTIRITFRVIEEIINDTLPNSALGYRSWWRDTSPNISESPTRSWLAAGWQVKQLNFIDREVTFCRAESRPQD